MTLDQYVYDPDNKSANTFGATLKKGIFRTITGKIPLINQDGFTVKTSRSTIGIRGCELGFQTGGDEDDQILIIEILPGRHIFVSTSSNPQGQIFTTPRFLRIGRTGLFQLSDLTPEQINQFRQLIPLQNFGFQTGETGGGENGGGGGTLHWIIRTHDNRDLDIQATQI